MCVEKLELLPFHADLQRVRAWRRSELAPKYRLEQLGSRVTIIPRTDGGRGAAPDDGNPECDRDTLG